MCVCVCVYIYIYFFFFPSSYRDKAKEDVAAVGNHVAKLLQSIGQVSCWAHGVFDGQHSSMEA